MSSKQTCVLKAFYLVDSTVWKDMDPLASEVY